MSINGEFFSDETSITPNAVDNKAHILGERFPDLTTTLEIITTSLGEGELSPEKANEYIDDLVADKLGLFDERKKSAS